MVHIGRLRLGLVACTVTLVVALLSAVPASAASPRASWTGKGKPHIMRPVGAAGQGTANAIKRAAPTNGTGSLIYGKGPVQRQPQVFLDFWGAEWTNGTTDAGGFTGATAQTYIQTFLHDIAGSAWFGSQTQYCDSTTPGATTCAANLPHVGTTSPNINVWNNTSTTPIPTDLGIFNEADAAAAHFGLQNVVNATVIVLTPTNQSYFQSGNIGFCGYHSFTDRTVYAYIPWMPDAPNGGASCATNNVNPTNDAFGHGHFDGYSIVLGHEVAEAATDPLPGAVFQGDPNPTFGWLDTDGFETADKCEALTTFPATNVALGATANDRFAVQALWSNSTNSCPTEDLAGGSNGHAAITSSGANNKDVFIRGLDGALYTKHWDGTGWSPWASLGGGLTTAPSAVSWGAGRIDVFAEGRDGALWHIAFANGGWTGWQSLGGLIIFGPAASSWAVGGLDVAAVGRDHAMWHIRWNGSSWSPWQSLGGGFTADPSAVSWRGGSDRVDIFARGQDGQLWQDAWTGSAWSGWLARGGGFNGGPAVASTAPGLLQVFGVGLDNALWHETWNGSSWSGFSSLGGTWPQNPSAVSPPSSNAIELAMVGSSKTTERLVTGAS